MSKNPSRTVGGGSIPAARRKLIERIVAEARRLERGALAARLLRAYYHGVAEEDLAARDPHYLAATALDHLSFGRLRPRHRALVSVGSPTAEQGGRRSPHTQVLIVTADMPFLVDSAGIVFSQAGIGVHLIVHPVLAVERGARGELTAVSLAGPEHPAGRESWQLFEIDRQLDPARMETLEQRLRAALEDVRAAVTDWRAMRERALGVAEAIAGAASNALWDREARETRALLEWMADDHFTFLGYRRYRLRRGRRTDVLVPERRSGLGILRAPRTGVPLPVQTTLSGDLRRLAREPRPLLITKANSVSTVHRAAYLDYVGIKIRGAAGEIVGEHRFLGLWTSAVYQHAPSAIPVVRQKVADVAAYFALAPGSHDAKAVLHALESYPRDELFQASVPELVRIVRGIVNLYERALVRLFVRRDAFERFYSCLVYVPRDRYNTQVRLRIESILRTALGGRAVDTQVELSESTLARLHAVVRTREPAPRSIDAAAIEQEIARAASTWADRLRAALAAEMDETAALAAAEHYLQMFPAAYREEVEPRAALADIAEIEALRRDRAALRLRFDRPPDERSERVHLRIVKSGEPVAISDILPMMENFGLRVIAEHPYPLAPAGSGSLQDFELEHGEGASIDLERSAAPLREGFLAVWRGEVENDGFNRLLLGAGLRVREITVLRAYCRYLLQAGVAFSQAYMERVLAGHPDIARSLLGLFVAELDPSLARHGQRREARMADAVRRGLDAVKSLDADRILRAYLHAIAATVRTNYFATDAAGAPRPYLALKLDPERIPELSLPRPKHEIFVYGPRVEAVHLRMAAVARGGIRWSDRPEDFRTEILGLLKAQNVKNTVIVPMGAKGGFVVKRPPAGGDPAELRREVIACYRTFMRGLLDLTDNLVDRKIVPPALVRRDGPDVYLVVAADKGTADFSDIANAVAHDYGYWLGDAFASGGSAGYDHKQMGITARGAWECVKRHFRELGRDIERHDFTAAGIGDMSGDVFGNGMLLSRHIRLQAAFDHRHIFLDPAPDARRSFAERARLFALPRSSWADYDPRVISRGGAVHSRAAKAIDLTPEARRLLGLAAASATPQEIIRAILTLPVDLLWNGGIGTYVKAASESQLAIGDRANDPVRVNGSEVRAKVVGEGGNLGFSQAGRIEYARSGGRLNTDFIDNSAGVNTSDVEVNIKILLNPEVAAGRLRLAARNRLIERMQDEVARLVLRNNYLQSQALSTLEPKSAARLPEYGDLMRSLERSGDLDRSLEFLPDDEALAERRKLGLGLTRPELSVLLAYGKISLTHHLLASDVPEDPYLSRELERYFPRPLRRRFAAAIPHHRLRREIIVTATANSLVNRMGPLFAHRAAADTGAAPARIAR
ncbi:MAG: NAD-glutamate dehydrogenase, partial [Steroidobacteraceae bacterium]